MKTPISILNVLLYTAVGALALGFIAAAGPALVGAAHATKIAGLSGAAVGAVAGFVVGLSRRFR